MDINKNGIVALFINEINEYDIPEQFRPMNEANINKTNTNEEFSENNIVMQLFGEITQENDFPILFQHLQREDQAFEFKFNNFLLINKETTIINDTELKEMITADYFDYLVNSIDLQQIETVLLQCYSITQITEKIILHLHSKSNIKNILNYIMSNQTIYKFINEENSEISAKFKIELLQELLNLLSEQRFAEECIQCIKFYTDVNCIENNGNITVEIELNEITIDELLNAESSICYDSYMRIKYEIEQGLEEFMNYRLIQPRNVQDCCNLLSASTKFRNNHVFNVLGLLNLQLLIKCEIFNEEAIDACYNELTVCLLQMQTKILDQHIFKQCKTKLLSFLFKHNPAMYIELISASSSKKSDITNDNTTFLQYLHIIGINSYDLQIDELQDVFKLLINNLVNLESDYSSAIINEAKQLTLYLVYEQFVLRAIEPDISQEERNVYIALTKGISVTEETLPLTQETSAVSVENVYQALQQHEMAYLYVKSSNHKYE